MQIITSKISPASNKAWECQYHRGLMKTSKGHTVTFEVALYSHLLLGFIHEHV